MTVQPDRDVHGTYTRAEIERGVTRNTIDIERNNFEVSMLHVGATKAMLSKDEKGLYQNQRMQWMWEGWQKSAKHNPMDANDD